MVHIFNLIGSDIFSFILVLFFAASIVYRISFLRNKELWHLSLIQVLFLIVIPGFMFVISNSYIQSIIRQPRIAGAFISDELLVNFTLLSMLFGYGGVAIHSVTKMLSEKQLRLRYEKTQVAEVNRYFHLNFSHNLIYSSGLLTIFGLTLLELNHIPQSGYGGWVSPIIRGVLGGVLFVVSLYQYTRSKDHYVGRWADLKAVFFVLWLCFVTLLYVTWKTNPDFKEYRLLIPVLSMLSLMIGLNTGLIVRWVRRKRRAAKEGKIVTLT